MSGLKAAVLDKVAVEWGKFGYSCWDDLKNDFILNPSSREIDNKDLLQIAERISEVALLAAAEEAHKVAEDWEVGNFDWEKELRRRLQPEVRKEVLDTAEGIIEKNEAALRKMAAEKKEGTT